VDTIRRYTTPLAITTHYSQCPGGREPLAAGIPLAYNQKVTVYSQYFLIGFWVFASKAAGSLVSLWKPPQRHKEPVAKLFPHRPAII
jgi:hypothetical protein